MWDKQQEADYAKEYVKLNKDKLSSYRKKWYENNKTRVKQYRKDNKEKIAKQQKEWHEAHRGECKELWKEWYKLNPERSHKRRFTEAKKTAKKRNIEWKLTFNEYSSLIDLPCHYCENQLGKPVKRSIGLDRLDSNKCYELDNVVSCCYQCNCMKHIFLSPEEMKLLAKTLIEFRISKLNIKS